MEVLNSAGAKQLPSNPGNGVQLENLSQYTIVEAFNKISPADVGMATFVAYEWGQIKQAIDDATNKFQTQLDALEQSDVGNPGNPQTWSGAAHDAAIQNLMSSYSTIETISKSAGTLQGLVQTFANTIQNTQNAIVPQYFTYQALMNNPADAHNRDVYNYVFNRYAQNVLTTTYAPPIVHVANTAPPFPTATPQVDQAPTLTATPHVGQAPTPTATPQVGGPELTAASNTPSAPQDPTTSSTAMNPAAAAASSPASSDLGQQLSSPMQGLSQAMSPLQSALGQAMNPKPNTGAPPGASGLGKPPPEGKLALGGPKGGAGAGGGSAGAHGPAISKAAGAPATAAGTTTDRTPAAGSRAGLSSGAPGSAAAGAPGAGAPAGGQQGGAAQGSQHQPSKVLRRKRNGEKLVGDADAVVPVLGEPALAAAKPDTT